MKQINFLLLKYKSHHEQGFTLIELLVVVIIVGVMSVVALPSLIAQVGKAREAEAKNNLGVVSRAQQAYHFEHQAFFNGNDISSFIEVGLSSQNYFYTADTTASANKAIHHAYAINPRISNARDFSTGTYYNAGLYSQTLCVATGVDSDGTTSSVIAQTDGSCTGGKIIK